MIVGPPAVEEGASARLARPTTVRRWRAGMCLCILLAFYALTAADGIVRLPIVHGDEMWNAAPAYMLATTGVYGSDLFRGHGGAERRTYQFMPMLQLLLAAVFRVAGVGLMQMRLLSIAIGALVLTLTYLVGRQAAGARVGLIAVAILIAFPLTPFALPDTGIPFVDLARTMRYHVLVPAFGLAALLVFNRAELDRSPRVWPYMLAGFLCGLAYLSHIYGAFWLPALLLVIGGRRGGRALFRRDSIALVAGFGLACVPWAAYVLTDLDDYRRQTHMYADRFDVLRLNFYVMNVRSELQRYTPFVRGLADRQPGSWIALMTFPFSVAIAARQSLSDRRRPLFAAITALITFAALDALLLRWKTFSYVTTVLPIAAVMLATGWTWIWDRTRSRAMHLAWIGALVVAASTAGWHIVLRHREAARTTPYAQIEAHLSSQIPAGARVLVAHRFWLGLRDHPVRTWLLPFMLADCEACDRPRALAAALAEVAPDVIVIDDLEFGRYFDAIRDPASPLHWQDGVLRDYFREHRVRQIGELHDPAYQTIHIYQVGVR